MPTDSQLSRSIFVRAQEAPTSVAVVDGDSEITYEQLWRSITEIRQRLDRAGVTAGSRVGISMDRSWRAVAAMVAVVAHGCCYVPLDPTYPPNRLDYIARDSAIRVVCVDSGTSLEFGSGLRPVEIDGTFAAELRSPARRQDDAPCYVIYTSGSTGTPKGVEVPVSALEMLLASTADLFGFHAADVWAWFHSYSFDFAVWEIWGALASGARIVVVPSKATRNPAELLVLLRTSRVTILNQVPSAFRYLAKAYARNPGGLALRHVIFGGEALDRAAVATWRGAGGEQPQFVNMYGITETTVHVTYRVVSPEDLDSVGPTRIGEALPHLEMAVVVDGRPAQPGETGELWVAGSGLAAGYVNLDALTAERFPHADLGSGLRRWYRSGDLGRRLGAGDFEYLGRIDQQVSLRGYRIELGEVEAAIQRCPGVENAMVSVLESPGTESILLAHLVPDESAEAQDPEWTERVRRACRDWLPPYMTPNRYAIVDALPVTPSGKLDRSLGVVAKTND